MHWSQPLAFAVLMISQVSDEIAKLKYKEPQSTKIVQLEQELVRAEAQSLVAEAQLSNIASVFHDTRSEVC